MINKIYNDKHTMSVDRDAMTNWGEWEEGGRVVARLLGG
jgi:hypothetical protein